MLAVTLSPSATWIVKPISETIIHHVSSSSLSLLPFLLLLLPSLQQKKIYSVSPPFFSSSFLPSQSFDKKKLPENWRTVCTWTKKKLKSEKLRFFYARVAQFLMRVQSQQLVHMSLICTPCHDFLRWNGCWAVPKGNNCQPSLMELVKPNSNVRWKKKTSWNYFFFYKLHLLVGKKTHARLVETRKTWGKKLFYLYSPLSLSLTHTQKKNMDCQKNVRN